MRSGLRSSQIAVASIVVQMISVLVPTMHRAEASPDLAWHAGIRSVIASSVAEAPSGQILAPDGSTFVMLTHPGDAPYGERVVRLDPSGAVDPAFGVGGIARPVTNSGMTVLGQSTDGIGFDALTDRVYVAGSNAGFAGWGVAAMTSAGQPVQSWGSQGWLAAPVGPGGTTTFIDGGPPKLVVDSSGRVLIAGYVGPITDGPMAVTVARLTSAGVLDPSFGEAGLTIVPLGTQPLHTGGAVVDLVLDSAGRIVLGGWTPSALPFVARLDANGALDQSFGANGVVVNESLKTCVNDLAVDPHGGVVLLCQYPLNGFFSPLLRRLTPGGAVDTGFGIGGVALVPRRVSPSAVASTVAVVGGHIVVGGWTSPGSPFAIPTPPISAALWRFTMDGDLDLGEGTDGVELISDGVGARVTDLAPTTSPGGVSVLLALPGGQTDPGVGVLRVVPTGGTALPSAVPLPSPRRVLDTRIGLGAPRGKVKQGGVIALQVGGVGGVPTDAVAVALNLTVTEPDFAGFATVYSCGVERPEASNLNWVAEQTVPNLVLARLDSSGRVCIFLSSPASEVADVTAFFPTTTDLRVLDAPVRRIDTRVDPLQIPLKIGGDRVASLWIYSTADQTVLANEVIINVTVTEPEASGYITVYPCDEPRPLASNLNFVAGQTVANLAVVRGSANGFACFFSNVPTHLVVDVEAIVELGSGHRPISPSRLLDTRTGVGSPMGPIVGELQLQVAGRAGIAVSARAVTLNVTVTEPVADGFVTVYPCGAPVPSTSNVNFRTGETRSNAALVGIGVGGRVCLFSNVPAHLVSDVSEWFTARD